jgi:hypothetical protein
MLTIEKVTYLINVEYIYEGDAVVGVRHTDTGAVIPDEDGPYTEEELRAILAERAGKLTPQTKLC